MTQHFPAAAPCLVPPSTTPPDDAHRRGAIYGITLAADHLEAQAREHRQRARARRTEAAREEDVADTLEAQAQAIRAKARAL